MIASELLKKDAQHIWHPLTQHKTALPPLAISHAQGNYLYDHEGNKYFDAISSWYTCSYGHVNPALTQALKDQVDQLHHVVFAGMTHEPAVRLSEKLLSILPDNQEKLFFSENGSTSVEIALKMAFQYHFNRGEKRLAVVALEGGFHGDTFGAMSASGLSVYNGPFEELLIEVIRIPAPTSENMEIVLQQVEQLIAENDIASFIYEPLVQGAAAMQMNDASGLCRLIRRFRESGILSIADEVMTGFGKTGSHFASSQIQNRPDIICLSKALTGGIMPMAITSCTQEVYDAFLHDENSRGFFHGHTYSGSPLGCAVAAAGIDLLVSENIQEGIKHISLSHAGFLDQLKQHPAVGDVRHCGVILAFDLAAEMQRYGNERNLIFQWFWKRGVFLRPLGKTIYLVPPFTTTAEELKFLYDTILEFLDSRAV
ncbi:adenosylmethionine--8-amino-7-oxononanoate transaminase [Nonlabens marinus]|uniref:Adenosylmethionine-8-amino-7-oxononanoate aminotransferase n=1 Tax=Nonlabens marinus S1-08 TaxID=1454201 RepID=W8VUM6_9FLAO|nr:adenosylmethionine--8-amino-7-oxononanoate transaminase [Nonlabens marinus]BAO54713.1 adenosylmethionine-8-amino-7-oxononanoate aminotransferase [Nonlabens marinus S1-08]